MLGALFSDASDWITKILMHNFTEKKIWYLSGCFMRQWGRKSDDFSTVFMSKNITCRCEDHQQWNILNAAHPIFKTGSYRFTDISSKIVTDGHVIQKTSGSSQPW